MCNKGEKNIAKVGLRLPHPILSCIIWQHCMHIYIHKCIHTHTICTCIHIGCPDIDGPFNIVQQEENKESLIQDFCVAEVATLHHIGPHALRHPTRQVIQHLCRDAADVFHESGF